MIAVVLEHADQIDLLLFGLNCVVFGAFIGLGAGAWIDSKGAVKSGPLCGVFDPEYGACMQNRGHVGLHLNVSGCQFPFPVERGRELTPELRP